MASNRACIHISLCATVCSLSLGMQPLIYAAVVALFTGAVTSTLTWSNTKFLLAFGDSYTYVLPPGFSSPIPNVTETSSNGPNWIQYISTTYNVTSTQVSDMAFPGATIDSALVPPAAPYILSVVDQVARFEQNMANSTAVAWSSSNALFVIWIGINDIIVTQGWSNMSSSSQVEGMNAKLMDSLFSQVDKLYTSGARSFLFLTVPPIDRTPYFIQQGPSAVQKAASAVADYNSQLSTRVRGFKAQRSDLDQITLFDTHPIFNTLLDNAGTFGYVNITGYCEAYESGTPNLDTQIEPCAPVANYFWLNAVHPMFTVHNMLAHAIASALGR